MTHEFGDVLGAAEMAADEIRNATACPTCGSPEPVRVGMVEGLARCSDCHDWPRCVTCRRWLDTNDDWSLSVPVTLRSGDIGLVCHVCQDRHVVVTTDADGWIESIEEDFDAA